MYWCVGQHSNGIDISMQHQHHRLDGVNLSILQATARGEPEFRSPRRYTVILKSETVNVASYPLASTGTSGT